MKFYTLYEKIPREKLDDIYIVRFNDYTVTRVGRIVNFFESPIVESKGKDNLIMEYIDSKRGYDEIVSIWFKFNIYSIKNYNVDYITFIPHFDEFRGAYMAYL